MISVSPKGAQSQEARMGCPGLRLLLLLGFKLRFAGKGDEDHPKEEFQGIQ